MDFVVLLVFVFCLQLWFATATIGVELADCTMSATSSGVPSSTSSSRPRRAYGRSATTSVTQLLSESDVVKTCTNLLQRLGAAAKVPQQRFSDYTNNNNSSNMHYTRGLNGTHVPPDSPRSYGSRKDSTASNGSNQSDSYTFVKYKPPLPTGASHSNHLNGNHQYNHPPAGGSSNSNNNNAENGTSSSSSNSNNKDGVGSGKSNFSYFGNDRLKELEQKFSERYNRLFGSSSGNDQPGNSSASAACPSGVGKRNNFRNSNNKVANENEDFRGYGLAKSASTSGGSRPHYSSMSSPYGLGLSSTTSYGSNINSPSSTTGHHLDYLGGGNLYSSSSALSPRSNPNSNYDFSRRNYGLSKSASSSVLQDTGLDSNSSSSNSHSNNGVTSYGGYGLAGPAGSYGSSTSKYYPYVGTSTSRLYGSNSTLEPVPEVRRQTLGYGIPRSRELSNSRSGLFRSSTSHNLDRTPSEDVSEGSSRQDDDTGYNGSSSSAAGASQRKNSYKLPSRYYYRRYRHKSSYIPTKEEASPLTFTNDKVAADDDNNNVTRSSGTATSSLSSSSLTTTPGLIPSSHVLAYDTTPRNKVLKEAEDILGGGGSDDYKSSATGAGQSSLSTDTSNKENELLDEPIDPVELARKKEIEELIKKYSGITYTSSKYVQLQPGANSNSNSGNVKSQNENAGASNSNNLNNNNLEDISTTTTTKPNLPTSSSTTTTSSLLSQSSHNINANSSLYAYGLDEPARHGHTSKNFRHKDRFNAVIYGEKVSPLL